MFYWNKDEPNRKVGQNGDRKIRRILDLIIKSSIAS